MRESTYNQAVNRLLPKPIWVWKIATPYRRGIPDNLYLGPNGTSLWAEFKYDDQPPPVLDLCDPDRYLTKLQQKEISRIYRLGHRVCVIYGCRAGGVLLEGLTWRKPMQRDALRSRLVPKRDVAQAIAAILGVPWPGTSLRKTLRGPVA